MVDHPHHALPDGFADQLRDVEDKVANLWRHIGYPERFRREADDACRRLRRMARWPRP